MLTSTSLTASLYNEGIATTSQKGNVSCKEMPQMVTNSCWRLPGIADCWANPSFPASRPLTGTLPSAGLMQSFEHKDRESWLKVALHSQHAGRVARGLLVRLSAAEKPGSKTTYPFSGGRCSRSYCTAGLVYLACDWPAREDLGCPSESQLRISYASWMIALLPATKNGATGNGFWTTTSPGRRKRLSRHVHE